MAIMPAQAQVLMQDLILAHTEALMQDLTLLPPVPSEMMSLSARRSISRTPKANPRPTGHNQRQHLSMARQEQLHEQPHKLQASLPTSVTTSLLEIIDLCYWSSILYMSATSFHFHDASTGTSRDRRYERYDQRMPFLFSPFFRC